MLWSYERLHSSEPWLTRQMIGILSDWLHPGDRGLEWGSGRSTSWLAARVQCVVTIEDDPFWLDRVEQAVIADKLEGRVTLHHAPLTDSDQLAPSKCIYVRLCDEMEPDSLDFVLVDGALRDHCTWAAISKLKSGGILIIDNAERYIPRQKKSRAPKARGIADGFESPVWERVYRVIAPWRSIWTTNGVTDTAFWIKP